MNPDMVTVISEVWAQVREYISRKQLAEAADGVIQVLEEQGCTPEDFQELSEHDPHLALAWRRLRSDLDDDSDLGLTEADLDD